MFYGALAWSRVSPFASAAAEVGNAAFVAEAALRGLPVAGFLGVGADVGLEAAGHVGYRRTAFCAAKSTSGEEPAYRRDETAKSGSGRTQMNQWSPAMRRAQTAA